MRATRRSLLVASLPAALSVLVIGFLGKLSPIYHPLIYGDRYSEGGELVNLVNVVRGLYREGLNVASLLCSIVKIK